jgi:hypothetical protein
MAQDVCPQAALGDDRTEGVDPGASIRPNGREVSQWRSVLVEQRPALARQLRSSILELGPSRQSAFLFVEGTPIPSVASPQANARNTGQLGHSPRWGWQSLPCQSGGSDQFDEAPSVYRQPVPLVSRRDPKRLFEGPGNSSRRSRHSGAWRCDHRERDPRPRAISFCSGTRAWHGPVFVGLAVVLLGMTLTVSNVVVCLVAMRRSGRDS